MRPSPLCISCRSSLGVRLLLLRQWHPIPMLHFSPPSQRLQASRAHRGRACVLGPILAQTTATWVRRRGSTPVESGCRLTGPVCAVACRQSRVFGHSASCRMPLPASHDNRNDAPRQIPGTAPFDAVASLLGACRNCRNWVSSPRESAVSYRVPIAVSVRRFGCGVAKKKKKGCCSCDPDEVPHH